MENLTQYLNDGIERLVRQALKSSFRNPLESAFVLGYINASRKRRKSGSKRKE